ncbi:MAG: ROK family protein [Actinobacteria bacterium]|nr:ROK family protein [Actinomycetota bacterium]
MLAIDLGGTKISGAIVDSDYQILHEITVPSRDSIEGIADPNLQRTKELIRDLCQVARERSIPISMGCAGFPEYVNLRGELTTRDNIDWVIQPQLDFEQLTGFKWLAQSDVRCAGEAEAFLGAGKDTADFVYLTISSGISHTHFLNGQAVTGADGEAIGFGLIEIEVDGEKVLLENYASGLGISRRYARGSNDFSVDAKQLMTLLGADERAYEIVASATNLLGKEIGNLAKELKTEKIVIGGGLWLGSEEFRKLTIASFQVTCRTNSYEARIVNAEVANSGVIGAAIYAFAADASANN